MILRIGLFCMAMCSANVIALPRVQISAEPKDCNCRNTQVEHFTDIVKKVSIRGDSDDRVEDMSKATSGAMKVLCKQDDGKYDTIGSSQLIGKSVITTSAHLFFDANCNPIERLDSCAVIVIKGSKADFYKFKENKMEFGTKCPQRDSDDDWAVIRLEKSPGTISKSACLPSNITNGSEVVMITADSDDKSAKAPERLVQKCKIIEDPISGKLIKTDCDTKKGNSGAGIFLNDCLVGIHKGSSDATIADFQPADPIKNHGQMVPVTPQFLDAIKNVSK